MGVCNYKKKYRLHNIKTSIPNVCFNPRLLLFNARVDIR